MSWRPMNEAPKGQAILVYIKHLIYRTFIPEEYTCMKVLRFEPNSGLWAKDAMDDTHDMYTDKECVAWMPLPAPPVERRD